MEFLKKSWGKKYFVEKKNVNISFQCKKTEKGGKRRFVSNEWMNFMFGWLDLLGKWMWCGEGCASKWRSEWNAGRKWGNGWSRVLHPNQQIPNQSTSSASYAVGSAAVIANSTAQHDQRGRRPTKHQYSWARKREENECIGKRNWMGNCYVGGECEWIMGDGKANKTFTFSVDVEKWRANKAVAGNTQFWAAMLRIWVVLYCPKNVSFFFTLLKKKYKIVWKNKFENNQCLEI